MSKRFPDVTVEIYFEDALADVVATGFDAGIRLGSMVGEDMVTVRLAPAFKVLIVGAPDYLARSGSPKSIGDLKQHNCIQYRLQSAGGIYRWDLRDGSRAVQVATGGSIVVNDMLHAIELALAGVGLCYTFEPVVRERVAKGQLVEVLGKASIEELGLSLYYPQRASLAPKLRAFIDTARDVLKKQASDA